jgi:acyl-coenzyme A synthetase/AMP-(fatty) acid ligase
MYWTVMLSKKKNNYSKGDQIKEDEMGGALSLHGREDTCVCVFGGKT